MAPKAPTDFLVLAEILSSY